MRLIAPRGQTASLFDVGERTAFIAGQRVGHVRRRRRRHRGLRLLRRAGVLLLALATVAGAATGVRWALTAPRFAVTRVEVVGVSGVGAERVRTAAAIEPGTNLWRIDPTAVAGRVEAVPEVRRADVIRRLPNRLTILVEDRRPFTLVHGSRLHWLDEDGRVLSEAREAVSPPVPVVSGLEDDELVTAANDPAPRVRDAIALIRVLLRSGSALIAQISEIDMSRGDGPVLYTVDGVEVRLGSDEWEDRLARLERVLAQFARAKEGVRAIDLRFRDQVVLTKGGPG